jgi:hypothetical protein
MSHIYIKQFWVHYPTFVLWGFLQGLTSMTTNLNQRDDQDLKDTKQPSIPSMNLKVGGFASLESKATLSDLENKQRKLLDDREATWWLKSHALWLDYGDKNT